MWSPRWEVEPITLGQRNVSAGRVEDDRPIDAEQDLVIRVLVLAIRVSGLVRPDMGIETLFSKRVLRLHPGVSSHR